MSMINSNYAREQLNKLKEEKRTLESEILWLDAEISILYLNMDHSIVPERVIQRIEQKNVLKSYKLKQIEARDAAIKEHESIIKQLSQWAEQEHQAIFGSLGSMLWGASEPERLIPKLKGNHPDWLRCDWLPKKKEETSLAKSIDELMKGYSIPRKDEAPRTPHGKLTKCIQDHFPGCTTCTSIEESAIQLLMDYRALLDRMNEPCQDPEVVQPTCEEWVKTNVHEIPCSDKIEDSSTSASKIKGEEHAPEPEEQPKTLSFYKYPIDPLDYIHQVLRNVSVRPQYKDEIMVQLDNLCSRISRSLPHQKATTFEGWVETNVHDGGSAPVKPEIPSSIEPNDSCCEIKNKPSVHPMPYNKGQNVMEQESPFCKLIDEPSKEKEVKSPYRGIVNFNVGLSEEIASEFMRWISGHNTVFSTTVKNMNKD